MWYSGFYLEDNGSNKRPKVLSKHSCWSQWTCTVSCEVGATDSPSYVRQHPKEWKHKQRAHCTGSLHRHAADGTRLGAFNFLFTPYFWPYPALVFYLKTSQLKANLLEEALLLRLPGQSLPSLALAVRPLLAKSEWELEQTDQRGYEFPRENRLGWTAGRKAENQNELAQSHQLCLRKHNV